jgi:hypothetical protein
MHHHAMHKLSGAGGEEEWSRPGEGERHPQRHGHSSSGSLMHPSGTFTAHGGGALPAGGSSGVYRGDGSEPSAEGCAGYRLYAAGGGGGGGFGDTDFGHPAGSGPARLRAGGAERGAHSRDGPASVGAAGGRGGYAIQPFGDEGEAVARPFAPHLGRFEQGQQPQQPDDRHSGGSGGFDVGALGRFLQEEATASTAAALARHAALFQGSAHHAGASATGGGGGVVPTRPTRGGSRAFGGNHHGGGSGGGDVRSFYSNEGGGAGRERHGGRATAARSGGDARPPTGGFAGYRPAASDAAGDPAGSSAGIAFGASRGSGDLHGRGGWAGDEFAGWPGGDHSR